MQPRSAQLTKFSFQHSPATVFMQASSYVEIAFAQIFTCLEFDLESQ